MSREAQPKLKLAVVTGSVREGRFGPVVATWFREQAQRHNEFEIDTIDLADYAIPLELPSVPPARQPDMTRTSS
jgi:NAD(P)H-dependent FMN reductase